MVNARRRALPSRVSISFMCSKSEEAEVLLARIMEILKQFHQGDGGIHPEKPVELMSTPI